jgi:hypothetical protein
VFLPRRLFSGILGSALACSLAANVYFLMRTPETAARAKSVPAAAGEKAERIATDSTCEAELEKCRQASAGLVLGLWGNALHGAPPDATRGTPPPTPSPPPLAEGLDKREALCQVARDNMRAQWVEKKDAIAAGLTFVLSNPAQQRDDAEREAQQTADTLGVSGSTRRNFVDSFVDTRLDQLRTLAPLAQGGSIDWRGLLDGAHSLFGAEDAVVAKELGPDALPQFQSAETARRLTILSMLATYADAGWDETVAAP